MLTLEGHKQLRAQREREAAQRRKQPFVFHGVDLQVEIAKMLKCLELNRNVDKFGRVLKKPLIRVRHSAQTGYSGRGGRLRVVVTFGRDTSVAQALEILLHELCHTTMFRRGRNESHTHSYIALLVRSACELWGLEGLGNWREIERGSNRCLAYAVDQAIMKELQQRIEDGLYVPAQATPPPAVPSRAERAETLKAKREAHARQMLVEHQRKLAREQKLVRKWKQKVTYYEKQAAKKRDA